jgi:hypothetical protein
LVTLRKVVKRKISEKRGTFKMVCEYSSLYS